VTVFIYAKGYVIVNAWPFNYEISSS